LRFADASNFYGEKTVNVFIPLDLDKHRIQMDQLVRDGLKYIFLVAQIGHGLITSTSSKRSIRLFPNPTKDVIFISTDNGNGIKTISIVDYKGMEVIKATINNNHYKQLSAGIYFAITGKGQKIRFIKNLLYLKKAFHYDIERLLILHTES